MVAIGVDVVTDRKRWCCCCNASRRRCRLLCCDATPNWLPHLASAQKSQCFSVLLLMLLLRNLFCLITRDWSQPALQMRGKWRRWWWWTRRQPLRLTMFPTAALQVDAIIVSSWILFTRGYFVSSFARIILLHLFHQESNKSLGPLHFHSILPLVLDWN